MSKRRRKKSWISWVLILVLLVAAGAICYLVWESYFKEKEMDRFIFREIGSGRIFVVQGAKDEWNAFMFTDGMDFVERKDLNINMAGHLQEDFARTVAAATADAF